MPPTVTNTFTKSREVETSRLSSFRRQRTGWLLRPTSDTCRTSLNTANSLRPFGWRHYGVCSLTTPTPAPSTIPSSPRGSSWSLLVTTDVQARGEPHPASLSTDTVSTAPTTDVSVDGENRTRLPGLNLWGLTENLFQKRSENPRCLCTKLLAGLVNGTETTFSTDTGPGVLVEVPHHLRRDDDP